MLASCDGPVRKAERFDPMTDGSGPDPASITRDYQDDEEVLPGSHLGNLCTTYK